MKVVRSLDQLQAESAGDVQPSVVTIGNFDGVHCGHRMVISKVIERAQALTQSTGKAVRSVAVTFDPHPAHVLGKNTGLKLLTPLPHKLELLSATGLDLTLVLPFNRELSSWSAREFASLVLSEGLHALEVHEGETFRFGRNAETGVEGLAQLGQQLGFTVQTYQPCILRGGPISSSRVRELVLSGNVHQARPLLGRPFAIRSVPASGRGYGTRYAVPTINLAPYPELLPAHGVYITTLRVGTGPTSRTFQGVTNSGNRPTFGADSFAVETHLFDFEPIALDESTPIELTFLRRLRGEQRFPTPEALRAQIGLDVARAKRYFQLCSTLSTSQMTTAAD